MFSKVTLRIHNPAMRSRFSRHRENALRKFLPYLQILYLVQLAVQTYRYATLEEKVKYSEHELALVCVTNVVYFLTWTLGRRWGFLVKYGITILWTTTCVMKLFVQWKRAQDNMFTKDNVYPPDNLLMFNLLFLAF